MPKLSAETGTKADAAAAADSGGGGPRDPLPEGRYRVRLLDVEATKSAKGAPMWKWKFEVEDGAVPDCQGRWLWENTVLTEAALWKLGQIFAAFGVPADTDTDDLIGSCIDVQVAITIAERGKMKGKEVNDITSFIPAAGAATPAPAPKVAEEIPF